MTGTFSDFGFVNDVINGEPTHYFYSTGLNASMDEFDALPEGSSTTDILRALFEGTDDTVYTQASLDGDPELNVLPEGFENVVIEGYENIDVIGNTQDNIITGNAANNVIDGRDGIDTYVTQGDLDQSTGILNQNGSVMLTSQGGGTDLLINIENVQFDDAFIPLRDINFSTEDSIILPEWLNDIVIEGVNDAWVIGNSLDNQFTGNFGNNVIDGSDGVDTFITQGAFDQSKGILNRDGSVRLISDGGGTDLLVNIEQVQFDDRIKAY